MDELNRLRMRRELLKAYLLAKFAEDDWHGVWDAAVDIKVLETRIAALEERQRAEDEADHGRRGKGRDGGRTRAPE
jgi:hypothetical protein